MNIIPTPDEAASYEDLIARHPGLEEVLAKIIAHLKRSKGRYTWFDADVVPSNLFSVVRCLLAKKGWVLESGYNQEESYSYLSVDPCKCQCCKNCAES